MTPDQIKLARELAETLRGVPGCIALGDALESEQNLREDERNASDNLERQLDHAMAELEWILSQKERPASLWARIKNFIKKEWP